MLNKNDIFNGVYGLAVGDALGVPVEFSRREQRDADPVKEMREYGTHNQPKGTWSDDTSMTLATLDALCAEGLHFGRIMDNFKNWLINAKYTAGGTVFDVGGTCHRSISSYAYGYPLELCGENDIYSNGNGSLMRMLPMIYYVYFTYGTEIGYGGVHRIYEASGLTHAHIISKVCCVYYVYMGIYIMKFGKEKGLQKAIEEAIQTVNEYYTNNPEEVFLSQLSTIAELPREEIKSTGYVIDSLEASIWSLYNSSSYREAVELAVNLGGDTDTIGSITGSLAGLYYGVEDIPAEWVDCLQNKELINSICERFYEMYK